MNLSTRQLRAFVALAELRNFTRAAAVCHLSQSAFSSLIRALEDELGVRLFDRSTRHVDLTAEGREFAPSAQRVLVELEATLGQLRDRAAHQRGRASLALLPSLAAGWLPAVLAGYRAQYPGIEVEVMDILSEPCIERVRGGQADFALAATRAETPELRAEPFHTDGFHLVAPSGHALLQLAEVRPRDLLPYEFVHLSRNSSVRQYLEAATLPLQMRSLMEVDQLATVMGMVRAGLGISVVPALALFHFQQPGIATRPLRWPHLRRAHLPGAAPRPQPVAGRAEPVRLGHGAAARCDRCRDHDAAAQGRCLSLSDGSAPAGKAHHARRGRRQPGHQGDDH